MPDTVLRRSLAVVTGADRVSKPSTSPCGHAKHHYSLTRRVLAVLLGIDLPVPACPAGAEGACPAHVGPNPALPTTAGYDYFVKAVKAYATADPPDRLQSRLYALESLKDLNELIGLLTIESSLRGVDVALSRVMTNLRLPDTETLIGVTANWAHIRSCQLYISCVHQHTLREIRAHVEEFAGEYWASRRDVYRRTGRQVQLDYYMRLLQNLRATMGDVDKKFHAWRSRLIIEIDPHVYHRGPAVDIIRRVETNPEEAPEHNLEDVRDALAVASHDFVGADLRDADLEHVPLGGIRWNAATRWPKAWLDKLRSLSTEVEPGVLQVESRSLPEGL